MQLLQILMSKIFLATKYACVVRREIVSKGYNYLSGQDLCLDKHCHAHTLYFFSPLQILKIVEKKQKTFEDYKENAKTFQNDALENQQNCSKQVKNKILVFPTNQLIAN